MTCIDIAGKTVVRMYDRNLNGELSSQSGRSLTTTDKIIEAIISNNHMVYKQAPQIKTMAFIEVPQVLNISPKSQVFIGDLNGDYIDDVVFNLEQTLPVLKGGKLSVAIFNTTMQTYDVGNFKEKMVDPNCGGFQSQLEAPQLTTPHSVSMVDFDGDCLADLFLTV